MSWLPCGNHVIVRSYRSRIDLGQTAEASSQGIFRPVARRIRDLPTSRGRKINAVKTTTKRIYKIVFFKIRFEVTIPPSWGGSSHDRRKSDVVPVV
jgi:hypothetical protein